jgi:hypothetical protein
MLRAAWALAVVFAAMTAAPLEAQQQIDNGDAQGPPAPPTAQEVADAAQDKLRAAREHKACPLAKPGEIVVCAPDPDDLRVPSDLDQGINSHDPVPRAPDLFNLPPRLGVGVTVQGCFIPPCPRKMPPIIDLKAIPEAPPGSDAARHKEDADADERAAAR